jgi:hypothetical protein
MLNCIQCSNPEQRMIEHNLRNEKCSSSRGNFWTWLSMVGVLLGRLKNTYWGNQSATPRCPGSCNRASPKHGHLRPDLHSCISLMRGGRTTPILKKIRSPHWLQRFSYPRTPCTAWVPRLAWGSVSCSETTMAPFQKNFFFPFNCYNLAIHVVTLIDIFSTNY